MSRVLQSHNVEPSTIKGVQVIVGSGHGDTAFQFGAEVAIMLSEKRVIDFEITDIKLMCRKDTASLREAIILPRLTRGLERVATHPLHIHITDNNEHIKMHSQFGGMVPDSMQQLNSINEVDIYALAILHFRQ
jgi:hypothetical protein